MAGWVRAGGGGIPSSLKSDMDAVLNKKFGTSTTYPPTGWPDDVNLMGPLPEKTASGAIAHVEDGADTVPIKSWDVTVDANLDGLSSIKVTQAGKNLVDGSNFTKGLPATTIGSSINTISSSDRYSYFGCDIKGGSYNISSVSNDSDYYNAILIFGYSGGFLSVYTAGVVNGNKTVDLSACDYVRVCIGTRGVGYSVPTDFSSYGTIQLEIGSYTSYAAYTAPTVTTVSLGRTIYGGSADVVTGEGEDENGDPFTFTPITPTPETALGVNNFWADEGDSEVTYRADINLVISALNNNRGLMMMSIPEEQEETEEPEPESDER